MPAPSVTHHRRPFLAPIWLGTAIVLGLLAAALALYRATTLTTVVVVRHAEKQPGIAGDPPLAPEGEERAQRLARMFGERAGSGGLRAIYVSDTRRAQQTAAPLAERLGLTPIEIPATAVEQLVASIRREHRGGEVLVIGHSNTVPRIVHGLSSREVPAIPEDEYDTLYVVSVPSVGPAGVLRMQY